MALINTALRYMYRMHGKFEDCIFHGIDGRHLEKDFHNFGFESHDHLWPSYGIK